MFTNDTPLLSERTKSERSPHSAFGKLLKSYLSRSQKDSIPQAFEQVLTLGCGECFELESLLCDIQGGAFSLVGVDLDGSRIARANARSAHLAKQLGLSSVPQFVALNGLAQKALYSVSSSNDLVIFRHQNFWFDPKAWTAMFDYALRSLSSHGVIFLTSYFRQEHLLALQTLRALGGTVIISERNPHSTPLSVPGKWIDGYCALISNSELRC